MELTAKTVLITGSNRGIGLAFVEACLARGVGKIYAAVRDVKQAESLQLFKDDRIEILELDVNQPSSILRASERIAAVDVVINNAGIAHGSGFLQPNSVTIAEAEMLTNYFGPLRLIHALSAQIRASQAAIINVSSIAALCGYSAMGPYSASKAALQSLTQSLRGELSNHQIIGVYPGPVDTRLTDGVNISKAEPLFVAKQVLAALEQGINDVYPDDFSRACFDAYRTHPEQLAQNFAASIQQ